MYSKEQYESVGKCLMYVHGGIGRNIMSTAVIKNLKKQYPQVEVHVLAGCTEVFMKNPNVKRVHDLGRPSFVYEDYIKDSQTLIINVEPYQHFDYIYRKKHFVECWAEMIGIKCEDIAPEMYFNIAEQELAQDYLKKFDRRMVLFQHQGGKVPEHKSKKDKLIAKTGMYRRNLPENVVQEIVDGLIDRGFMVGSVGHENQFLPKGAEQIKFPIRAISALVPYVSAVISIDSFLLHASACFRNQTPVMGIWGGTDPRVLGYGWHSNMIREACDNPMCHRPNSYLHDIVQTGYMWDCPHNDICMNYKAQDILGIFDKMMKEDENGKPTEENNASSEKAETLGVETSSDLEVTAGVGADRTS